MDEKTKGFRGLTAWIRAYELMREIYTITKSFPREEAYGMTSQLQRAAISIPADIAEGCERNHRKEYLQFLFIAKGSLGEVETYLLLAQDLGYIPHEVYILIECKRAETSRVASGLIRSLS